MACRQRSSSPALGPRPTRCSHAERASAELPNWYPDWARSLAEQYFSGTASVPYAETDAPEPQSVYAQSKLVGAFLQFAKAELAAERPVVVRNDAPKVAINAR